MAVYDDFKPMIGGTQPSEYQGITNKQDHTTTDRLTVKGETHEVTEGGTAIEAVPRITQVVDRCLPLSANKAAAAPTHELASHITITGRQPEKEGKENIADRCAVAGVFIPTKKLGDATNKQQLSQLTRVGSREQLPKLGALDKVRQSDAEMIKERKLTCVSRLNDSLRIDGKSIEGIVHEFLEDLVFTGMPENLVAQAKEEIYESVNRSLEELMNANLERGGKKPNAWNRAKYLSDKEKPGDTATYREFTAKYLSASPKSKDVFTSKTLAKGLTADTLPFYQESVRRKAVDNSHKAVDMAEDLRKTAEQLLAKEPLTILDIRAALTHLKTAKEKILDAKKDLGGSLTADMSSTLERLEELRKNDASTKASQNLVSGYDQVLTVCKEYEKITDPSQSQTTDPDIITKIKETKGQCKSMFGSLRRNYSSCYEQGAKFTDVVMSKRVEVEDQITKMGVVIED